MECRHGHDLTDCTLSGNITAATAAAALDNSGTANLTDCTVSGNSAAATAAACRIPARPT